jgi:hypothetical protein
MNLKNWNVGCSSGSDLLHHEEYVVLNVISFLCRIYPPDA